MQPKKSILIVDDDIAHRTMLRILLDWNYEISEADDGSTAIDALVDKSFDLIIMDIMMPGDIDGLEATRIVKNDPETGNSHIVLLTAKGQQDDLEEGFKAGADDYFVKGNYERLIPAIEREVKNYKLKREKEKVDIKQIESEKALQISYQELSKLNYLGKEVNSSLSINQVVKSATNGLFDLIKPDLLIIFICDNDEYSVPKSSIES